MQSDTLILFPPFRLEVRNEQLWRDNELLTVRPKPFAVLAYLATHPGRLVTAAELRKAVWPNTYVGEGLLRGYIREVRLVLGDDPEAPRFIETIPRRGYRFLPAVSTPSLGPGNRDQATGSTTPPPEPAARPIPDPRSPIPALVGRETELQQLHGWLDKALTGQRQLVFVTGEPGIGKTTLVDAFLSGIGQRVTGNGGQAKIGIRDWGLEAGPSSQPSSLKPLTPSPSTQHSALSTQHSSAPTPNTQHPTPDARSPFPIPWIARGQCVEHYGSGEAYLPVLEALGQLCRQPGGERLIEILRRHAPTWLVQLPSLVTDAEFETLERKVQGAARERMLRELAEAIEAFTVDHLLVLVLEDLHWCDYSTLDLLGALARRREPARLLVIGSYRPADVIVSGHPLRGLKQELQSHRQGHELALSFLTEQSVAAYLAKRLTLGAADDLSALHALARRIHRHTDGNPLFMVGLTDYWTREGTLLGTDEQQRLGVVATHAWQSIPDSLRQMVEQQLDRLSAEEQQLLEVASVAGEEFLAAVVIVENDARVESLEERYEELAAHGQFVRFRQLDTLPDGAVTGRYRFLHALYQQIVYERLAAVRRIRLHRAIGERLEQLWSAQAREHAMELAVHFERGQDGQRAVQYLWHAAENARRKHAYHETVALLRKSVDLLKTQPDTVERTQQELALLVTLGVPLLMTKGYAAPEVEQAYARARQLCQEVGESPQLLSALAGLFRFYFVRADFSLAQGFAEQVLRLAQQTSDSTVFLIAHCMLGVLATSRGEFVTAREHFDQGVSLYDLLQHRFMASLYGDDPGITCLSLGALSLWFLGYPDQASQSAEEGVALARTLDLPYNLAFALDLAAWVHFYRGERQAAQTRLEPLSLLVSEQGFQFFTAESAILQGWVMTEQGREAEGLAQMRPGVVAYHATGAEMARPTHLGLLAKTYGKVGQIKEGFATLAEAFAVIDKTGECCLEAELWRLKGELTFQQSNVQSLAPSVKKSSRFKVQSSKSKNTEPRSLMPDAHAEAEGCFLQAIEIARRQQAKSLELRAVMSLARLWQQQGKHHEARNALSEIYGWFTEGFDTKDLRDAKVLLGRLRS